MNIEMMVPRIQILKEKPLVGMRMRMSFSDNRTHELWRGFMPRRKEIVNSMGTDLYSVQVYDKDYFNAFDPARTFDKWAAMEVPHFGPVPDDMMAFVIPGGLYAVFLYKGTADKASETFQYIFNAWLPSSDYVLDDRPHFEVLGARYRNNDPSSEEEIWIPIMHRCSDRHQSSRLRHSGAKNK